MSLTLVVYVFICLFIALCTYAQFSNICTFCDYLECTKVYVFVFVSRFGPKRWLIIVVIDDVIFRSTVVGNLLLHST